MQLPSTIHISNLSYLDNEESIRTLFNKYGNITNLQPNLGTQTCLIHYSNTPQVEIFNEEIISNHKILKVVNYKLRNNTEIKTKNGLANKKRIFISNINKNLKIVDIRKIVKLIGKVVDVRVQNAGPRMRNKGYCFVEFKNETDALKLLKEFKGLKNRFGQDAKVEFANSDGRKHLKP